MAVASPTVTASTITTEQLSASDRVTQKLSSNSTLLQSVSMQKVSDDGQGKVVHSPGSPLYWFYLGYEQGVMAAKAEYDTMVSNLQASAK